MKNPKKQETLKDWCKKWSIQSIIASAISKGMSVMADKGSSEGLIAHKRILVAEIKRRIKKS